MRSALLTVLALGSAALVQAGGIDGLPQCTNKCISNDFGGCGTLDVKCICANKPFIAGLACCISVACDAADQAATIQFADSLCSGQGVTDLPTAATCAAGATPSFISGATVSSTASAATTTGSPASTTTGSASSATGTSSASSASAASSSASSSSSSASAAASHTGSANRVEAAAFGVGAVIFGALAAL
ncbi:hypothetical protein ANO11243_087150 [Dothideomycetidae sp. 11243]|nr:hypothetical protein ANO11243_087150 [fungal sp. No.11243]